MVIQCIELFSFLSFRLSYAKQFHWQSNPALRPDFGKLFRIPLGQSPSLHSLRNCLVYISFVRLFLQYYGTVRLPEFVHYEITLPVVHTIPIRRDKLRVSQVPCSETEHLAELASANNANAHAIAT